MEKRTEDVEPVLKVPVEGIGRLIMSGPVGASDGVKTPRKKTSVIWLGGERYRLNSLGSHWITTTLCRDECKVRNRKKTRLILTRFSAHWERAMEAFVRAFSE